MSPNEIIYALQSWPAKIAELNELLKADRAELAAAKAECERLTTNQREPAEDIFVSHLCDELARLRALSDQLSNNLSAVGAACNGEKDRAEKAEAELITERARLDYLALHMGTRMVAEALNCDYSKCFPIRDAIDAAMKNETTTP
jgi:outer membrane murein-binding lipoprotein Lpp